jgi:hypothetical protein
MSVVPDSGVRVVWALHPDHVPVESRTKLPSSSGPDWSVVYPAVSSPAFTAAVASSGPAPTEKAALTGPAIESAGVERAGRGNESGIASQIRPQAVSVWVGVPLGPSGGDAVAPPGTGVSSADGGDDTAGATDGATEGGGELAAGEGIVVELPQAAVNRTAERRTPRSDPRRMDGVTASS